MFGFLGIFGRAQELRRLDEALRAVDLHPRLVPEAVKLTALRLLQQESRSKLPPPALYGAAAELLAYCLLGPDHFAAADEMEALARVEARVEQAAAAGDSLDARLILLTLQAKLLQPAVAERYGLEAIAR